MAPKGFASRLLTRCQIEITGNALKTLNKVSYLHLILANKKALNIEFSVKPLLMLTMKVSSFLGMDNKVGQS